MKLNNLTNKKENIILIAVTIFLILGFITLINYNYSITGYTTIDSNETLNESSEAYNILIQDYYFRTGYMQPFPVWPPDTYSTCNNDICFYFNVSNTHNETENCTLFLNIDGAGYNLNETFYDAPNWTNMSDAFSITTFGANDAYCITTNGTDFWITDAIDDFVYHLNSTYDNQTDGFSTATVGSDNPRGITYNGSDFWIVDITDDVIYHLNSTGDNQTDAVNISKKCGANNPRGITTNGSDFWITDPTDDTIYHLNSTYDNQTDGINILTECGANNPRGITTNGSDFWFVDSTDGYIYHLNSTYDNQTDGIDVSTISGSGSPQGITTPSFNMSLINPEGAPREFYIVESPDNEAFIYHIKKLVEADTNHSICKTFDDTGHTIQWKVGCYTNESNQINTSAYTLTLNDCRLKVNITFPKNATETYAKYINFTYNASDVDDTVTNCSLWLDLNDAGYEANETTDDSITEIINQTFNKTFDSSHYNITWKVGCYNDRSQNTNASAFELTLNEYQTINLQFPKNNTRTDDKSISFTYNVSDLDSDIDNCSLWLDLNDAGYEANETTDDSITEIINQTFNKTFENNNYKIYWKVGCYSDNEQINSTAHYLNLITPSVLTGPANDPYRPPYEPPSIPELPPPAEPVKPDTHTEIGQQVDEMNIDPGFNSILKELLNIDLDLEPRLTIIDILNKTLLINIGDETEINIDYSKKKPTLLIKGISKGTKPKLPSILKNLTIFLIILVAILILYFIIQYLTPTIYKEKYKKKPIKKITLKPIENIFKINKNIIRFNKLSELIKLNISENNLALANNHYEKLLQVYNFLILKLNEEDKAKLYSNTKDIYNLLKQAIEINFYKKSLKK